MTEPRISSDMPHERVLQAHARVHHHRHKHVEAVQAAVANHFDALAQVRADEAARIDSEAVNGQTGV